MRSAHPALSPKCFTAQFDFAALNKYSYEKIHTASLVADEIADRSPADQLLIEKTREARPHLTV